MLMIHAETNIPISKEKDSNFDDVDIIKLYVGNSDFKLVEKKYNYEYENSMLSIDDNDFSKYPTFKESDVDKIKNMLSDNQPIVVLNYYFMKKTFERYNINLDSYQVIDLSKTYKKLNLYGDNFKYNIDELVYVTNIDSGVDKNLRGYHMIELYKYLIDNTNLSNEDLLSLNYKYSSNIFDSKSGKFSNQELENIPHKVLISILTFDSLNIKLNGISIQEFKFNIIRHILENNINTKDLNLNNISNKEEFDLAIDLIFKGENKVFIIENDKLEKIYTLCDLYFKVNNNNLKDIILIKKDFINNTLEVDDLDEIGF